MLRRQRGVALILVLWLVTLLAVVASAFALSTQRESVLLRTARDRAEALALLDGALRYAWLRLHLPKSQGRWLSNGAVYEVVYGNGRVRLELRDEAGKVNLNYAQELLMTQVLAGAGLSSASAARIGDAILDWRDVDDLRRLNGAEAEDYRQAGKDFGPRNRPFDAVEELRAVLGMSPELYQRVAPWVTVYTRQAGIDPRASPPELLLALPGISPEVLEALKRGKKDVIDRISQSAGFPVASGSNAAVGVRALARLNSGGMAGVNVVLGRRNGQGGVGFLYWRETMGFVDNDMMWFESPVLETISLDEGETV
jgi:general secretion pathway protein K